MHGLVLSNLTTASDKPTFGPVYVEPGRGGSCYPALPQGGNESPPGLTLSPHSLAFLKDAEECSLSTEAGKGGGTGSDIIKWPG